MSLIKEIGDLHDALKAILLNIFLMSFWYASIYLFNADFYHSSDIIILLVMCFIISLSSSSLLIFIGAIFAEKQLEIFNETGIVIVLLSFWVSVLMFIFYSLQFIFNIHIDFYYFLISYYAPSTIFYLVINIYEKNSK